MTGDLTSLGNTCASVGTVSQSICAHDWSLLEWSAVWSFQTPDQPLEMVSWVFLYPGIWPKPIAGVDDPLATDYDLMAALEEDFPGELVAVYNQDMVTLEWTWFIPGEPLSTLPVLEPRKAYHCQVSGDCEWDIPQVTP